MVFEISQYDWVPGTKASRSQCSVAGGHCAEVPIASHRDPDNLQAITMSRDGQSNLQTFGHCRPSSPGQCVFLDDRTACSSLARGKAVSEELPSFTLSRQNFTPLPICRHNLRECSYSNHDMENVLKNYVISSA